MVVRLRVDRVAPNAVACAAAGRPRFALANGIVNVSAMDRLDERYAWVLAHVESLQRRIDFLKPFRRAATGDARWN